MHALISVWIYCEAFSMGYRLAPFDPYIASMYSVFVYNGYTQLKGIIGMCSVYTVNVCFIWEKYNGYSGTF